MDATDHPLVWTLNESECWNLLSRSQLGRLAVVVDGKPDIFPINYVVSGPRILFRTAPGTKLAAILATSDVAFQVDEYDDQAASSVVVKGAARHLEVASEIDEAEDLPLTPWIPTLKYRWVRITPRVVTGRRFVRAEEPARYSTQ